MKSFDKKVLAGLAVTILALATVAPFAEAAGYRTSNSDYYRGPTVIHRSYYPARGGYYYGRSSGVGPALAGFFGGLVLGSVLTSHSQPVYHEAYPVRVVHVRYVRGDDCDRCQDHGYYGGGGYSRTYDRDQGVYRGDRDWDNGSYRDDRGDRDNQYDRGDRYDRNDRNYRDSRDYRNDRNDQQGDGDDDDN